MRKVTLIDPLLASLFSVDSHVLSLTIGFSGRANAQLIDMVI